MMTDFELDERAAEGFGDPYDTAIGVVGVITLIVVAVVMILLLPLRLLIFRSI